MSASAPVWKLEHLLSSLCHWNSASIYVLLMGTEIHLIFLKWRRSVIPRKEPAKDPISSCVLALLPRSATLYTGLDRRGLQLRLLNASARWCFGGGEGDILCTATCGLTSCGTSGLLPTSRQPGARDGDRFPERSAEDLAPGDSDASLGGLCVFIAGWCKVCLGPPNPTKWNLEGNIAAASHHNFRVAFWRNTECHLELLVWKFLKGFLFRPVPYQGQFKKFSS